MPILPPAPVPQPEVIAQPYYVRDRQPWAVEQERMRHNQALWTFGEYTMFALMWHLQDFTAGLVLRCSRCYPVNVVDVLDSPEVQAAKAAAAAKADKIASVYAQPLQNRCPYCYGTTFEGGYKALIVRPAIFSDTDESEQNTARGVVHPDDVDIESTTDFRVRTGDYAFRANGDRWQLGVPQRITLRTGFATPHQSDSSIGYNHASASIEDSHASVAYDIDYDADHDTAFGSALRLTRANLTAILSLGARVPEDFAAYEVIRGPLIPAGD